MPCPCLAVTREDGAEVVIWDASGTPRTFIYNGNPRKLCFRTHGSEFAGAYLSPCFDEEGLHGEPEETCFCGEEAPHIHAHFHNDVTCNDAAHGPRDISQLASVKLYPKDQEDDEEAAAKETTFEISENLPKACNSKQLSESDTKIKGQRYHKIQHGDHYDTLVLDQTADGKEQLILEHDCSDCGKKDIHGKFSLVSKRKLDNDVQVHFFEAEVVTKPFQLTDCLSLPNLNIFDTSSVRVQMATKPVRSSSPRCKTPTRIIGVKECPNAKRRRERASCCGCAHGSKNTHCAGATDSAILPSSEFAKLVRSELEKCCEDEECIGNQELDPTKSQESCCNKKIKETCCSSKTCSTSTTEKDIDASIGCGYFYDHTNKAHQHSHNTKTKESCCSNKTCSTFTKKANDDAPFDHGYPYHHKDSHKTKNSKCSSEFCSISAKDSCIEKWNLDKKLSGLKGNCCTSNNETCSKTASIPDTENESSHIPSSKSVRSVIECTEICCAAEIPAINKVLVPLGGVDKVLINVPIKCVVVDHIPLIISATDIVDILNKARFGASLKRDGEDAAIPTVGRSQLFVEKICCASEIPAINRILSPLQGVDKISVNVTNKLALVDHDTEVICAQQLCDALNEELFGASIRHDAVDDQTEILTTFVHSTVTMIGSLPSTEKLKVIMESYSGREIESFVADIAERKIDIVHNPLILPLDDIVSLLQERHSLDVSVEADGARNIDWEFPPFEEEEEDIENVPRFPKPIIMLSGLFWIISMFSYIGGNWQYLKYTALASVLVGLPPIGVKAVLKLRACQFDTNVLMFSAAVGALALQEFQEAAAVTFLFSISDWLETRATTRARNALSEIVRLRPNKATIFHPSTKELIVVPASSVPVGALVSAKAGAQIPCDGIVVGGKSTVNESSLTGESRPVKKGIKDKVSGGTINSGMNELLIRTSSTSANSAVSRLIRLVEEAQANRSETEKMVDKFAKVYTPFVIAVVLLMISIPWIWGRDAGKRWTETGLILLVVACPCALIISTPVTYVAGLAATAQRGILIKGGSYLEALSKVKKIAFDKTGTLTKGQFALLHLKCFGSMAREDILGYLALVEERASHPIAEAIINAVQNEGISIPKNVQLKNLTELEGEGVMATAGKVKVYAGNQRLFFRIGFEIPVEVREDINSWSKLGGTVGFLGVEGHGIVCAFCCADSPREESTAVLKSLKDDGIEVMMLTGDNRDAACLIGEQLGLNEPDIKYELLPEDKLTIIDDMKQEKEEGSFSRCYKQNQLVMMCGDGVNDAPALAKSDIGVAMGAGAALAMETSDLTLLDSNLEKLLYSIKMGKRVSRKIRENITFSFVTKAIVVSLTFAGYSYLWAAIAVDVGSMLVVTLNGMMLLPLRGSKTKKNAIGEEDIESNSEGD